jgi:hypothetical protein
LAGTVVRSRFPRAAPTRPSGERPWGGLPRRFRDGAVATPCVRRRTAVFLPDAGDLHAESLVTLRSSGGVHGVPGESANAGAGLRGGFQSASTGRSSTWWATPLTSSRGGIPYTQVPTTRFVQVLNDHMAAGDLEEVPVDPCMVRVLFTVGDGFRSMSSRDVWRLGPPDFPSPGVWESLRFG